MRVVHISDTSFITLPDGASVLVSMACGGSCINVGTQAIHFVSEAQGQSEYRRFIEWISSGDTQPFRFDPGYPVKLIECGPCADEPARLKGVLHPPEPLPVAGEVDALRNGGVS